MSAQELMGKPSKSEAEVRVEQKVTTALEWIEYAVSDLRNEIAATQRRYRVHMTDAADLHLAKLRGTIEGAELARKAVMLAVFADGGVEQLRGLEESPSNRPPIREAPEFA